MPGQNTNTRFYKSVSLGALMFVCLVLFCFFPLQFAHKAVLNISEEGTEAAAATATKLTLRSKDSSSRSVLFNRSFLLLVIDRATETMLFLGKVENPTKS